LNISYFDNLISQNFIENNPILFQFIINCLNYLQANDESIAYEEPKFHEKLYQILKKHKQRDLIFNYFHTLKFRKIKLKEYDKNQNYNYFYKNQLFSDFKIILKKDDNESTEYYCHSTIFYSKTKKIIKNDIVLFEHNVILFSFNN
jgi:hypothetical protein